ncbi:hypothetical protein [Leptospira noguchii]|nr:hypothetical protein [Leptospira noguchii]UOG31604.1 hypothetical protein MAL06_06245 [Leptospira noguchii]
MWELLQVRDITDQSLNLWELLQVRDITDQSLELWELLQNPNSAVKL